MQQNENKWHFHPYLQPEHLFKMHTNTAGFCFLVSIWTGRLSGESISAVWLTLTGFISQKQQQWSLVGNGNHLPSSQHSAVQSRKRHKFTSRQMFGKCVFGGLINGGKLQSSPVIFQDRQELRSNSRMIDNFHLISSNAAVTKQMC